MCNPPTSHILPHQLIVFLKIKEGAIKIVSLAAFRAPFAPKNIVDLLQRCIKVNNKSLRTTKESRLTWFEWVQIQVPSSPKSARPIHQFLNKIGKMRKS